MGLPYYVKTPDLFVTVNWTLLNITDFATDSGYNAVRVLVARTNQTTYAIRDTPATPLFPGSRLIGGLSESLRQRFENNSLAALGVPEVRIGAHDLAISMLLADARFLLSLTVQRHTSPAQS